MRYRQIHLDFHTSEHIPGIGSRFDPEDFADTLAKADVDSVTVFSKCHHGWSYHPTKVGKTHPHLDFDLLRAQLKALHSRNINAPIYISAGWDELSARENPGWRVVSPEGVLVRQRGEPLGPGWAFMDFNSPYLDYLCRQVEEVVEMFPEGNGFFIDICASLVSASTWAQAKMEAKGLDWTDPENQVKQAEETQITFFERIREAALKGDPKRPLFFNFGHIRRGRRDILKYFSHLEIESLPTAFWGYEHFPISARYVDKLGVDFLGMTGKFHNLWGEVGGYKKTDALLYECAAMLAQGAKCSVGDHLHPTGMIDKSTYASIGPGYAYVKAAEPWCEGSENRAEIGVFSLEAAQHPRLAGMSPRHQDTDEGIVRALLECQLTFDVLDQESDFSAYRLVIFPDEVVFDPALKPKVDAYVAKGGRVLLTGTSGIDPAKGFIFDVGATWKGPSPFQTGDYILPIEGLRADGIDNPLFMYESSQRIEASASASRGDIYDPYFDRTRRRFSGHVNTPSQPEPSGFASATQKGAFTYAAHHVFSIYKRIGAVAMLEQIEKLVEKALGKAPMVETGLPRAGRVTLRHQARENRDVLHLLHANPVLRGLVRGDNVQPIQDLVTLTDIDVSVEAGKPVRGVRLVPAGDNLTFTQQGGRVAFTVPELRGCAMVEIAY
ncbi:MAG: alpha-amylase family protein [Devosia sp.]